MILDGAALVILGAALAGAFASGLAGFAFGLVALGLWLHVLPPQIAGPLVVTCSLVVQFFTLLAVRRGFRFDLLWPFLVGGFVGVPIGVWLLTYADPGSFRRLVGVFLILYSTYLLIRPPVRAFSAGGRVGDGAIGLAGGVMGGLSGLSGPLPTLWCTLRGWPADVARGVYQPFNIAMHLASLVSLAGAGLLTPTLGWYLLLCVPALLLGALLGLKLYARVNETQFRKIILWLLLASGVSLVL